MRYVPYIQNLHLYKLRRKLAHKLCFRVNFLGTILKFLLPLPSDLSPSKLLIFNNSFREARDGLFQILLFLTTWDPGLSRWPHFSHHSLDFSFFYLSTNKLMHVHPTTITLALLYLVSLSFCRSLLRTVSFIPIAVENRSFAIKLLWRKLHITYYHQYYLVGMSSLREDREHSVASAFTIAHKE